MKTLSMVFSAPAMLRLHHQKWMTNNPKLNELFVKCISGVIEHLERKCDEVLPEFKCEIGLLYNGYTEEKGGNIIAGNSNYGFSKIYSDSGGLQVLTLGKEMNRELMTKVYNSQRNSHYAMAFDEIPAKNLIDADRANIHARMYYPEQAEQCAITTANNIREQCEFLINDKTQVMFITQGNCINDVVEWFERGLTIIPSNLWEKKIAGIALAGSCMGRGEQESIENMLAYIILNDKYPKMLKDRIHLLGYGSVNRVLPSIKLFNTHFVETKTLSFDSSSLSMSIILGKFVGKDGSNISVRTDESQTKVLNEVLDEIEHIFYEVFDDFDRPKFVEHFIKNRKSMAAITNIDNELEFGVFAWAKAFVSCYILYQTLNFWRGIRLQLDSSKPLIDSIDNCNTVNELIEWYNTNRHRFTSVRIARHTFTPVESFFS